jgi:hypothetical protein
MSWTEWTFCDGGVDKDLSGKVCTFPQQLLQVNKEVEIDSSIQGLEAESAFKANSQTTRSNFTM